MCLPPSIYRILVLLSAVGLSIACGSGCGRDRGPERVVVAGTVTYKGQPIPNGKIRFMPAQESAMPTASAMIVDGKYSADSQGGVPVGSLKVQIEAYHQFSDNGVPMPRYSQYIPKKYNSDSQLKVAIESGSGKVSKDFDLKD